MKKQVLLFKGNNSSELTSYNPNTHKVVWGKGKQHIIKK